MTLDHIEERRQAFVRMRLRGVHTHWAVQYSTCDIGVVRANVDYVESHQYTPSGHSPMGLHLLEHLRYEEKYRAIFGDLNANAP